MKEKKLLSYDTPKIDVISFNLCDVIATSGGGNDDLDSNGWDKIE